MRCCSTIPESDRFRDCLRSKRSASYKQMNGVASVSMALLGCHNPGICQIPGVVCASYVQTSARSSAQFDDTACAVVSHNPAWQIPALFAQHRFACQQRPAFPSVTTRRALLPGTRCRNLTDSGIVWRSKRSACSNERRCFGVNGVTLLSTIRNLADSGIVCAANVLPCQQRTTIMRSNVSPGWTG